ncbi:hypothetical protein D3C80_1750320 [compost metagenome]
MKLEREKVASEITKHEYAINNYVEKYIPDTEQFIKVARSEEGKKEYQEKLKEKQAELETLKSELADLQKQLTEIDAKISELEK